MKILVISPHPDDEVLGAGGTISRHTQKGDEVYLCIVTKAYPPDWSEDYIIERKKEVVKVRDELKIKKVYFLELPTVKLDTFPQKELNDRIREKIDEIKPEVVYTTHGGDINKDHRIVFEATLTATRPMLGSPVKKLLSYETLSSTEWTFGTMGHSFIPNVYVDITETLEHKINAMALYASELREYPHPRSLEMISILAKKGDRKSVLMQQKPL